MKKRIFLLLMFIGINLYASYPLMDSLIDKETSISTGVNLYIEARGTVPSNISTLVSSNYLPLDFNASNPINGVNMTFTVSNKELTINTGVSTTNISVDQRDYYLNNPYGRILDKVTYLNANILYSRFQLTATADTNLNISAYSTYSNFRGSSEPSTYSSVVDGEFWFSSMFQDDMPTLEYRLIGAWVSINETNQNFDSISGNFSNLNTITIAKSYWQKQIVNILHQIQPILCNNGATWNASKQRCEAYTSSAGLDSTWVYDTATNYFYKNVAQFAPSGTTYNETLNQFEQGANSACTYNGGTWNGTTCQKGSSYGATLTNTYTHCHTYATNNIFGTNGSSSGAPYGDIFFFINGVYAYTALASSTPTSNLFGSSCEIFLTSPYEPSTTLYPNQTYYTGLEILHNDSVPSLVYTCPSGGTLSGTTCSSITYYAPSCPSGYSNSNGICVLPASAVQPSGSTFVELSPNDRFVMSPSCTGKTMPVSPFYSTPYYGNNGVCYSDAGLYCQKTGVSWDGVYTCFDTTEHCTDSSWNLNLTNNYCEKYQYSCNSGYYRYGLSESPTNGSGSNLYGLISHPDDKLNAVVSTIMTSDVNVNDNGGAMCTQLQYSTLSQPSVSPSYSISGVTKSGF